MATQGEANNFNAAVEKSLAILADASNYVDWLASLALPFCRGRLMEVGSGLGTYVDRLLTRCDSALLTDYDYRYVDCLSDRFADNPRVRTAILDLERPDCSQWRGQFDTVVSFNVLEHISDHRRAMAELMSCLGPGGRMVALVPAVELLMGSLDRSFGHHRRYSAKMVRSLAGEIGARVDHLRYYNLLGVAGWIKSMLLGAGNLSAKEVNFFDQVLVPVCRRMEARIRLPFGLGLIFVLSNEDRA